MWEATDLFRRETRQDNEDRSCETDFVPANKKGASNARAPAIADDIYAAARFLAFGCLAGCVDLASPFVANSCLTLAVIAATSTL